MRFSGPRIALVALSMLLAGCSSSKDEGSGGARRAERPGPGRLCRRPARQRPDPAGAARPRRRLSGLRKSGRRFRASSCAGCSARARSSGQGQTLYQIDPSIYKAQAAQAQANLQSARASAEAARTRAERYRPLAEMEAISKQDYTDALAQARQANAAVAQNNAALRTAQINMRFTRVPAPITRPHRPVELYRRRAGHRQPGGSRWPRSPGSTRSIVDIQQSAADLLALRQALAQGGAVAGHRPGPAEAARRKRLRLHRHRRVQPR